MVEGSYHAVNTYSKANRLASVSGTTPAVTGIVYDAFGRRFSKTNSTPSTTLFTYDQGGNLLEESTGGVVTDYVYLGSLNIANWEPSEGHLYFINTDRQGTPQVSRDEYGLTNWAAETTAYGLTFAVTVSTGAFTGPVTQGLRLPGQYYDTDMGRSYNGARDYNQDGRYIEADPIGLAGGMNPYVYAGNNPGTYIDPTGLEVMVMGGVPPEFIEMLAESAVARSEEPAPTSPSPFIPSDPYSPESTSARQSATRSNFDLPRDPDSAIPDNAYPKGQPGGNFDPKYPSCSAKPRTPHPEGQRNQGASEEHSMKPKGGPRGGRIGSGAMDTSSGTCPPGFDCE